MTTLLTTESAAAEDTATTGSGAEVATEPVTEATAEVTTEAQTNEQSDEPDYSFVPKKFLKDGKPDLEKLSQSYQSLEKKLGAKGIVAPESADEYEFEDADAFDAESLAAFREDAHKLGLSTEQFKGVMAKYKAQIDALVPNPDKTESQLKSEWGDDYKANLSAAKRAFDQLAPSDISIDDPVFNNPTVLKLLARVGQELTEDSAPPRASATKTGFTKEEVDNLIASKDYWNDPDKQAKVAAWYKQAYKN